MVIPAEAVEAAARAGYEARSGMRWSSLDTDSREAEEFAAQCALEAAAPYMMAKAWEEGRMADDFEVSIGMDRNPYRTVE